MKDEKGKSEDLVITDMKEIVRMINETPTFMVIMRERANRSTPFEILPPTIQDCLIVRPVIYDPVDGIALAYLYHGPIRPTDGLELCPSLPWPEEGVEGMTIISAKVFEVVEFHTSFDEMPPEEMPPWAREMRQLQQIWGQGYREGRESKEV